MAKAKRKEFPASTELAGMMNDILPILQAQGWDNHYITISHGKGQPIYKYGVLTRDIPNPVVENLTRETNSKEKSEREISRKSTQTKSYTTPMKSTNPTQQADSQHENNSGAKLHTLSDTSVNTQNGGEASNPQYNAISLFSETLEISRKPLFRENSNVNTQISKSAPQLDSSTLQNNGGEFPYGREGRPLVKSAPVWVANSEGDAVGFSQDERLATNNDKCGSNVPAVRSMNDIATIRSMRMDAKSITMGIDTEFFYFDDNRYVLTWQFAFSDTVDSIIHECVFYSLCGERISMNVALAWIIEHYKLYEVPFVQQRTNGYLVSKTQRWPVPVKTDDGSKQIVYCKSYQEALDTCTDKSYIARLKASTVVNSRGKNLYHRMSDEKDVGYINDYSCYNHFSIPVTLLFHSGVADLPGFGFSDVVEDDIMSHVSSISGGLVSLRGFFLYPTLLEKHWYFRPVKVDIRDSLNFAPEKSRTLEILGKSVGVPKLELPSGYSKDDMLRLLKERPVEFLEYAINDSVVTVCYSSILWGFNSVMPVTLSSGAVHACLPILKEHFGCGDDMDAYNVRYRGLVKVDKGLVKNYKKGRKSSFSKYDELEGLDDSAKQLINYAKLSYKGGYNACFEVGWYDDRMTYDYDLKNAYATSMAACFDPDWLNKEGVTYRPLVSGSRLREDDFTTPYDMIFGCFQFEFPESVKYPCIPVTVGDSIVYPRKYVSNRSSDGVYVAGPELYLALKLGATITIVNAVKGKPLELADKSKSHAFRSVVKGFINDRNVAKSVFGEKSVADVLIKMALACIYGKGAQGILEKAMSQQTVDK